MQTTDSLNARRFSFPRRVWRYCLAAGAVGVAATTVVLAATPPTYVSATAGNPGVPGNPTTLFLEDFENGGSLTANPPKTILQYTGASGMTYNASSYWSSTTACNGMQIAAGSTAAASATLCGNNATVLGLLKELSGKLSKAFGATGDKFTIGSYTSGSGVFPDDIMQLKMRKQIPLPAGGAYLTAGLDVGIYNCEINAPGPEYEMSLTDAAGTVTSITSGKISPCLDPNAKLDSGNGKTARLVRTVGDTPALINSASAKITIDNLNVSSKGNDATFDNLQLIDVSPQIDKVFETPIPWGETSTITFTVTNTYSPAGDGSFTILDPKPGWSFTDSLPAGLVAVGTPTTGAGAEACGNFDSTGSNAGTVSVKGDLGDGQAYCTILVEVEAQAPGDYTNLASDVTTVGLKPPVDAKVTFTADPKISLVKEAAVTDANGNGITDAGDTIAYTFIATNDGNVPLDNVAISDPKVGSVTCTPTTVPVGGSVPCAADSPYTLTQADIDAGKVDNTAEVSGVNTFDPTQKVTNTDSVSTPVNPGARLELVKSVASITDNNASGLTDAGDTINYTFAVKNTGNVTLDSIRVDDPLVGTVSCPSGPLAVGDTVECTGSYTVTVGDEDAGEVDNTATAYGTTPAGVEVPSNTDGTTTPIDNPQPELTIVKSAEPAVDVNGSGLTDEGDEIQYTFVVTNTGDVPMTGVTINDPLVGSATCDPTDLAVGESTTCTADALYEITAADELAGAVTNVATASGLDPDGTKVTSEPDQVVVPVVTPNPELTIDKTADVPVDVNASGITDAGDTIQYRFTVTNTGDVPLTSVGVNDPLVGAVSCDPTDLGVGDVAICTAVALYEITDADEAAGFVNNEATATGLDPDGVDVESTPDTTVTPVATPEPSLVFDKSADAPVDVNGSGITDAGDTIQYNFVVTNNGNVPVTGVTVVDDKAGSVTCVPTDLGVGDFATCTADAPYVITEDDEAAGLVENTASATATDPDGDPVTSNPDTTVTPVDTPDPSLSFEKSADAPVDVNASGITDAGDTILYHFVVTNTGNVPLTDIAVADDKAGAVTCDATELAVGASTTCVADAPYVITEDDEAAGLVENTASATGSDPDGGSVVSPPDTTTTPVDTPEPSLRIDKSADAPVDVNASGITDAGDTILYHFVVTNDGNVPLTNIAVADDKAGSVTCDATELAVGDSTDCVAAAPYVITADDEAAGLVVNVATATGADPDGGAVESAPDETTTPVDVPAPSLTIEKFAGEPVDVNASGITDAGDTIRFSFVVTNNGNVPLSGVVVNDDLAGPVTCTTDVLAPGDSTDCVAVNDYEITEANEGAGLVVNTASAAGKDPDGGDVVSNTDTTTTPVDVPMPELRIDKTADTPVDVNSSGITDAGDTIQYRFTVTNTGNVPLTSIAVTDDLAGSVTCDTTSLGVDESTVCAADAVYVITAADVENGAVVNTATAAGIDPDGGPVESLPDETTTPVATPEPSLLLVKSADDPIDANASGLTDAGDTIQYRFTVTNNGNVPLTSIVITDDLAGPVTCVATSLAVGGSTTCTADAPYVITADDEAAGEVLNTATAAGTDPDGGDVVSPPDSTTTPVETPAPALSIEKSADEPVDVNGSGLTDSGDTIQYRFTVTNTGNVPVSGIVVTDPLAGAVECAATTLAVGDSTTCVATAVYVITDADETAKQVVNTASAAGVDPDGGEVKSNEDSTTTPTQIPRPSLVIVKSADTAVDVNASGITDAGDTIQYRFTVTNTGNVPISDIVVTDDLVGTVTCDETTLAVDQTTNCLADAVYTVTDADELAGIVVNTASAAGLDPDGGDVESNVDSTSTPVILPEPELTIDKSADAPVDVNASTLTDAGDTIQYHFIVTNTGNVPMTDIVVNDPIAGSVTCEATSLAVDESTDCVANAPYVITDADEAAGVVVNIASATGNDPDGGAVTSNTDSTTTPVAMPRPSLAFDKMADAPVDVNGSKITDAGDTIQFRFTVTNNGNVPISDVAVNDDLAGPVTCVPTSLAVGEVATCTADNPYVITEADEAKTMVVNTASASGSDPDGGDVTSNTDTTTTPVATPRPSLVITKKADPPVDENESGLTDPGDTILYSFTVTNTGNVPITNLVVNDPLVGPVTCTTTTLAVGAKTSCLADNRYVITDDNGDAGIVVNKASATGKDPDGGDVVSNTDTTATPVATPVPSLQIDKTADDAVDVNASGITDAGDTIQYRFTVTNTGNVPISDIVVSDDLAGPVTCAETSLAPKKSTTCAADSVYTVTVADQTRGLIINTASASGFDPNGERVQSNEDSETTRTERPFPHITLVKQALSAAGVPTNGPFKQGDQVDYSFTVTNDGNVIVSNLTVSDPVVGSVTCPVTTLEPGESVTCTANNKYTVTAADAAAQSFTNTATANAEAPNGENTSALSSTASATIKIIAPDPIIPSTGMAVLRGVAYALLVLGAGLILWLVAKRRRARFAR